MKHFQLKLLLKNLFLDDSNSNLDNWIKFNRFPQFAKINHGNLNLLIQSSQFE